MAPGTHHSVGLGHHALLEAGGVCYYNVFAGIKYLWSELKADFKKEGTGPDTGH